MRVQTLPQNYRHNKCGAKEAIPESIARNLVLDPCWYSRYTICPKCGEVPIDECTFLETG